MDGFKVGNDWWSVRMVGPDSPALIDRTGSRCLGTTDPSCHCVYLSDTIKGDMLARVLVHEMTHATLWSTGMIAELRSMVKPWRRIDAEEWVCNLMADFGWSTFVQARAIMGPRAIMYLPQWMVDGQTIDC